MERLAHLTAEQNLRLLGRFSLACADREIALPGVRSRALLAFLACNAGKPYPREKLAGLFWGGRFEVQARQSLRQALSALRKQLGPEVVDANRGQVRLAESFPSDVSRFLALIASGNRDDLRSEEHTSELQSLMRISYAVFCLKKKKDTPDKTNITDQLTNH